MIDPRLRGRLPLVIAVLCLLGLTACAEGTPSSNEAPEPVVEPGADRAVVSSGGGALATPRFKAQVSVGAPAAAHRVETSRFKAQIGIGPFIVLPPATSPAAVPETP